MSDNTTIPGNKLRLWASEFIDPDTGRIKHRVVRPAEPLSGTLATVAELLEEGDTGRAFTGVLCQPIAEGADKVELTVVAGDSTPQVGDAVLIVFFGSVTVGVV